MSLRGAETPWNALNCSLSPFTTSFLTEELKFRTASPVQVTTIPQLLRHRDVVVEAATGSGKTLSYLVPMFEIVLAGASFSEAMGAEAVVERRRALQEARSRTFGLVILPTRELALQVGRVARSFGNYIGSLPADRGGIPGGISVATVVGGCDISRDFDRIRTTGASILVATPGRLAELLRASALDVKELELLVLDEADRLLDGDFSEQIDPIIAALPRQRRTAVLSATVTFASQDALRRCGLRHPVLLKVTVAPQTAEKNAAVVPSGATGSGGNGGPTQGNLAMPTELTHEVVLVPSPLAKLGWFVAALARIAAHQQQLREGASKPTAPSLIMAFVLTCAQVEFLAAAFNALEEASASKTTTSMSLKDLGITIIPLHGKMRQQSRRAACRAFGDASVTTNEYVRCLVCTDVAARGLDFPAVSHVFQLDPPQDTAMFVHRAGRAGRFGRAGSSVTTLLPTEEDYIPFWDNRGIKLQAVKSGHLLAVRKFASKFSSSCGLQDPSAATDCTSDPSAGGLRALGYGLVDAYRHKVWPPANQLDGDFSGGPLDKKMLDLGIRAFVSYVNAYKEHHLRYVFKVSAIEPVELAEAFGLFRVPAMAELAARSQKGPGASRLSAAAAVLTPTDAWSSAACAAVDDALGIARKERLSRKAERSADTNVADVLVSRRNAARNEIKSSDLTTRQKRNAWSALEMEELATEHKALKLLKRKRITEAQYNAMVGDIDADAGVLLADDKREKAKRRRELAESLAAHRGASVQPEIEPEPAQATNGMEPPRMGLQIGVLSAADAAALARLAATKRRAKKKP